MLNIDWKKIQSLLLLVVLLTVAICATILLFFRSTVYTHALRRIIQILEPFIYGAVIAYLLRPTCNFLERLLRSAAQRLGCKPKKGTLRTLSTLLSMAAAVIVIGLLLMTVLPELITSITSLVRQLPDVVKRFSTWIEALDHGESSHELVVYAQQMMDTIIERLQNFLQTSLLPNMQTLISNVTSSFMGLFQVLKNFGLGAIIAAYILGSREKFAEQAKMTLYAIFSKKNADWILGEVYLSDRMFSGFISGKLIDSLIIGLICFAFTMVFDFPYAMLISVIVGVTNIIPFFGPYLGAIPSLLLLLTINPVQCLIFLVFIIVLQQFDGNILGPAILGDKLGISGFWILFSILVFSSLWGLTGMIIGAPLFAVLYDLIRGCILWALKKRDQKELIDEYNVRFPGETKAAPSLQLKKKPAGFFKRKG